jgi:hypothetical protein
MFNKKLAGSGEGQSMGYCCLSVKGSKIQVHEDPEFYLEARSACGQKIVILGSQPR